MIPAAWSVEELGTMADTNWVLDLFDLVQESGGNILHQDGDYICLQEFDSTTWPAITTTGSG